MEKVSIQAGKSGPWIIDKFDVSIQDAMIHLIKHGSERHVPAGSYTRLIHQQRGVVMSDTPAEMEDHEEALANAGAAVLINGLGIGMLVHNLLKLDYVHDITVVEVDEDVLALSAPHYLQDPRVTIIKASAYDYEPPAGKVYSMVWHDIWDDISDENLPQMDKLEAKYKDVSLWQGSWARKQCQQMADDWNLAEQYKNGLVGEDDPRVQELRIRYSFL